MVEQAAGRAVGGVHGAQEPPGLGQQLAHGGGAQLRKVGAAVDGAEVAQIPAAAAAAVPIVWNAVMG